MSAREEQPATVPPPAGEDDAYNATTKVGAMPAEVMARLKAEGLLPDEEEEQATKVGALPTNTSGLQPLPPPRLPPTRTRPPSFGDAIPTLHSDVPPPPAPAPPPPPAAALLDDLEESEKTEVADLMHLQIHALETETPGVEQMPMAIPISPSSAYDPNAPPRPNPSSSSARMGTAPVAFPPVGGTPPFSVPTASPTGFGPPPSTPSAPYLQTTSSSVPARSMATNPPVAGPTPNPAAFAIDDLSSASLDSKALGRGRLSKKQLLGLVLVLMVLLIAGLFVMALMSQRG